MMFNYSLPWWGKLFRSSGTRLLTCTLFMCVFASSTNLSAQQQAPAQITAWHTFIADTQEETLFTASIREFESNNPDVSVKIVRIPYLQLLQQFTTASQGGEAPDLVRINSRDLGKLGEINVNGSPILEDLRPHITPIQRSKLDARAVSAMRYDAALYSLPVSQSSLSLIYNKDLFDAKGVAYPNKDWDIEDMLQAAQQLTDGEVRGLAVPLKIYYWWIAFQTGFGGWLFDEEGNPTLDSPGSAEAMQWLLDLELKHQVVAPGTGFDIEAVKTQFLQGKAAMTIDGPWNWKAFADAGLNIAQELLPTVPQTGKRLSPLLAYTGWAISKQSEEKVAAMRVAMWLASDKVQRDFALGTFSLPTSVGLKTDPAILSDANLVGFMQQSELASVAPTTKGMALAYEPLNIAIDMAFSGRMTPQAALTAANAELTSNLED